MALKEALKEEQRREWVFQIDGRLIDLWAKQLATCNFKTGKTWWGESSRRVIRLKGKHGAIVLDQMGIEPLQSLLPHRRTEKNHSSYQIQMLLKTTCLRY